MNAPWNPAARGSMISLFGTGMGAYDRELPDGGIVGPPLAHLTSPVQATFLGPPPICSTPGCGSREGFPGTVLFAGAAPQQVVGVDQIDVEIPGDADYGSAIGLDLSIQGAGTTTVTVAIK